MFLIAIHIDSLCFFFFNDTATTEIYTLSLHDALPIYNGARGRHRKDRPGDLSRGRTHYLHHHPHEPVGRSGSLKHLLYARSEEHTSELQSRQYLVCRLLLEKKKKYRIFGYQTEDTTNT